MKFAALQFYPLFKKRHENIAKANNMLSRCSDVDQIDFLVLPEMAFSGYCFESKEDIGPFMEQSDGPSIQWACETSRRLNCYTVIGLPYIEQDGRYYNAAALTSRQGELLRVYKKHFLYETDERWSEEGLNFESFELEGFRVGIGICMDVNPYKFQAPFEQFEFSTFHRNTDILLLCMNWLTHEDRPHIQDLNVYEGGKVYYAQHSLSDQTAASERECTRHNVIYWLTRLSKLKNTICVISNRIGQEKETIFCGNSCVLKVCEGERPHVLGLVGRTEESLLVASASSAVSD